ncbi:hypothetical protein FLK61_34605 [Paenalkalicoccus suaedae]|uniref:Uncharacterized protein n=1 Tax=Paenalkalicoccus suaedae TaxID=2592382 RepID=A0A859FGM5_9BACI|nr:hypothetical protein [Paenalkalicoccus suaedae]QKS71804.1 hypothetical protein FLK61_34605 [Paenalkalicoccus suaedae]
MKVVVLFSLLFLLGCELSITEADEQQRLPIVESITRPPLLITYEDMIKTTSELTLTFLASHTDQSALTKEAYQFQWPSYVYDSEGIAYKVESVATSSELSDESLNDYEMGITMKLSPPPVDLETNRLSIPFYMVPRLYEAGYPFSPSENASPLVVGDISLYNVAIDDSTIQFDMVDNHPDSSNRNLQYLFTRISDEQEVYPLFSRIDDSSSPVRVELEFAEPISPNDRFQIDRTTASLPEWRFTFVIAEGE